MNKVSRVAEVSGEDDENMPAGSMTVGRLIEMLAKCDPNALVGVMIGGSDPDPDLDDIFTPDAVDEDDGHVTIEVIR